MTLQELITKLEELKTLHGPDITVYREDFEYDSWDIVSPRYTEDIWKGANKQPPAIIIE